MSNVIDAAAVAVLWVGLLGTGPSSLVFDPPSLLTYQVFWPTHFFMFSPPAFLWSKNILIVSIVE